MLKDDLKRKLRPTESAALKVFVQDTNIVRNLNWAWRMHDVLKEPDVQHKCKKASGTKIFEHANLIFLWAKLTEICFK